MYLGPRHISWPITQLHNGALLFFKEQSDHHKQWTPGTRFCQSSTKYVGRQKICDFIYKLSMTSMPMYMTFDQKGPKAISSPIYTANMYSF